jgi:hypothetical protein
MSIELTRRTPEEKAISKIIKDKGIIWYLDLNRKGELERLTRKYRNKPQGPQLLIDLIHERYRKQMNWEMVMDQRG